MSAYNPTPPPDELRDIIFYQDGNIFFTDAALRANHRRHENAIGHKRKQDGYKETYITVDGVKRRYYVHRLIYWLNTGEWPQIVDHINGIKDDNRIENLRASNITENHFNSTKRKNKNTLYRGVMETGDGFYRVCISIDKKQRFFYGYRSALAAAVARDCIALAHYGEHAKLNILDKLAGMRE